MKSSILKPAELVCARFRNAHYLAKILELKSSTIYNWLHRRNGTIPDKHYSLILAKAKELGIKLDASELVYGGKL